MSEAEKEGEIPLVTDVSVSGYPGVSGYMLVRLGKQTYRMPRFAADKLAEGIRCSGILRDYLVDRTTFEQLTLAASQREKAVDHEN